MLYFFFFFKLSTRKLDALGHRKESKQLSILPPPGKKNGPSTAQLLLWFPGLQCRLSPRVGQLPKKPGHRQTDTAAISLSSTPPVQTNISSSRQLPETLVPHFILFIYFFFHFSYTSTSLISALFLSPQTHTLMLSEMHRVAHTHAGLETTVLLFDSSFSQRACFRGLYQCLLYSSCSTRTRLLFFLKVDTVFVLLCERASRSANTGPGAKRHPLSLFQLLFVTPIYVALVPF